MKLRNKKTGEIIDLDEGWELSDRGDVIAIDNIGDLNGKYYREYTSLAELNEEWEDYEPKEPLIEDEKIRKAVRAWFNILPRLEDKRILYEDGALWVGVYQFDCGQYDILNVWLKSGEYYDIKELCGESEKEYSELKAKVLGTNYELEEACES